MKIIKEEDMIEFERKIKKKVRRKKKKREKKMEDMERKKN